MININGNQLIKSSEAIIPAKQTITAITQTISPETTKFVSESVTSIQKGLIAVKNRHTLNRNSIPTKYFGVNSADEIISHIENQVFLIVNKCRDNGIIESFPKRAGLFVESPKSIERTAKYFEQEFPQLSSSPARLTFYSKTFGENGQEGAHTIGLLFDKNSKTLFCLDSLPSNNPNVQQYQKILKTKIFKSPNNEIEQVIFSSKPQQNLNEYTCNNWTIANLEALQKALNEGQIIDTQTKLNNILPDDINKILQEQYDYVKNL